MPNIRAFYGPSRWFREQLPSNSRPLAELVRERDEQRQQIIVSSDGQSPKNDGPSERPCSIYAETSDYAMLTEGAINSFSTMIQSIDPRELILQNPPSYLVKQLQQVYEKVSEEHFTYPRPHWDALLKFRDKLQEEIVGQEAMKEELVASLYPLTRERQRKPIVLLFYGPSGVGKTETAKLINSLCGGTLFRQQFSMFNSQKFFPYLFGGEHSEASFARDLLERDNGAILLDEFDKANQVLHSAFYQLFDEGVFVDKNYSAQVGPAVIICTANYRSREEASKELGDPLSSRFDAMIEFQQLTASEIALVIDKVLDDQMSHLHDDERKLLNERELKSNLQEALRQHKNIRELSRLIGSTINLSIVRERLNRECQ